MNSERWASEKDDKSKKQFTRVKYKLHGWAWENGKSIIQEGYCARDVRVFLTEYCRNHDYL